MATQSEFIKVDMREAVRDITVTVKLTHVKEVTWRLRAGLWLVKLGIRISGLGVKWEDTEK